MYARLITANVQPDKLDDFPKAFSELVLPDASQEHGFKGLYMLKDTARSQIIGVVLWETEADAQASIGGFQQRRLPKMLPYLTAQPAAETLEVVLRA
jgi:heme-degrading monooxygenase HmoA